MKKYILYAHDGSGNHGCEALVRSTVSLLGTDPEHTVVVTERPEEDEKYGVAQLCTLIKRGTLGNVPKYTPEFINAYLRLKLKRDYKLMDWIRELRGVNAHKGDVALSIGGDTYCYGFTERLGQTHAMWKCKGVKTVYWGCSIEPELLENKEIAADIARYDLITARETISFEALKKVNPNTILVSDSAFLLNTKDVELPECFGSCDIVGINSSPLIEENETQRGIARKNYECLIETILRETTMKIMLIPHVVWKAVDDRMVLDDLYKKYSDSERVYLVKDCTCEELKGYISKCRFFVGARTHATIAAYSRSVPTLVVGYSVKAKGIARDLFGTEENYVLPVQKLKNEDDLTKAFYWLQKNELMIKEKLQNVMQEYSNRVYAGVEALKKL